MKSERRLKTLSTFNIRVSKRVQIASVLFTGRQMNVLGLATIEAMKRRWAKGLDVDDKPAKPLALGYGRSKQKKGGRMIPDLFLSGQMQESLVVQQAEWGRCKIGFNSQSSILKAYTNHQRRHQIGISVDDVRRVTPLAQAFLNENVRSAVRSLAA